LIKPFGYTDIQISIAAILLIVFGAVGAVLASLYLNRTQKYKKTIMICTIGACSTLILFGLQLHFFPTVYVMVCFVALMGFFVVPIIPLSYQIGCEVAFPIG
jgi:FLVCR family MFS transporter 7